MGDDGDGGNVVKLIMAWFLVGIIIIIAWPAPKNNGAPSNSLLGDGFWTTNQPLVGWANTNQLQWRSLNSGSMLSSLPNMSNIPLFEMVSIQFANIKEYNTSTWSIQFNYGQGYFDAWGPFNGTKGAWMSESKLFYPNMLTGLEYDLTVASTLTLKAANDTYIQFETQRTVDSSQKQTVLTELHTFDLCEVPASAPDSTKLTYGKPTKVIVYTRQGVSPWEETFAYLLQAEPVADAASAAASPFSSVLSVNNGKQAEKKKNLRNVKKNTVVETYLRNEKAKFVQSQMERIGSSPNKFFSPPKPTVNLEGERHHSARLTDKERKAFLSSYLDMAPPKNVANNNKKENHPTPAPNYQYQSYVMYLNDTWQLDQGLDVNAFLIGLQGLVNRNGPYLYFVYPPTWAFTDTPSIFSYMSNPKLNPHLTFKTITTIEEAIEMFAPAFNNSVIWDTSSRESLVAAFTVAGVDDALILSKAMQAKYSAYFSRLNVTRDLTGVFNALNDTESAQWVYERYWDKANKDYIVWMGGVMGNVMHPGIADIGIAKRCIFFDLSTSPAPRWTSQYNMAKKILSGMNPSFTLLGWHAYGKDEEHTFTTLASQNKVPLPDGYKFVNNVQARPETKKQIYLGLVQTDGIGLGAWVKPGRGLLPYTWEVTLPDLVLQPAVLRHFYSNVTSNDFFTAALSGPGYMYPKAVPPAYLPTQLGKAQAAMKVLNLTSMVIFDASDVSTNASHSVTGDTDLPKHIVDAYFQHMPGSNGFLNGYGPTFTFQQGKTPEGKLTSVASFDYYVDPSRSEADVVKDLLVLTKANSIRPYFLSIHVREWNTEARMASIIQQVQTLAGEEVTPLSMDNFVYMASRDFTFREHHH